MRRALLHDSPHRAFQLRQGRPGPGRILLQQGCRKQLQEALVAFITAAQQVEAERLQRVLHGAFGLGPVPAVRQALARAGWSVDQVDRVGKKILVDWQPDY